MLLFYNYYKYYGIQEEEEEKKIIGLKCIYANQIKISFLSNLYLTIHLQKSDFQTEIGHLRQATQPYSRPLDTWHYNNTSKVMIKHLPCAAKFKGLLCLLYWVEIFLFRKQCNQNSLVYLHSGKMHRYVGYFVAGDH